MSVQKVLLCTFHCKPKRSKVSLESPGLEIIPQVPGKRAEVDQNHDARNAVSAIVSVKVKCGYISAHNLESERSKSFALSISLQTYAIRSQFRVPGTGKYPQVPEYRPEVCQTHDASKAVSATLSVLSEVGLYFGPESRKCAFKKLCRVHFNANQGHQVLV